MNETAQPKWTVTRATVMAWATDSEWLARTDRKNLVTLIGDLVSLDAAEEQRHATEPSSASPERTGRDHFTEKVLAAAREECAEHASLGTHYAKGYDHAEQPLACNLCSRLTELDFFDRGVLPAPAGSASEPQKCPYSHTKLSDGHGPGEAPHCCYCGFTTCGCPKDWPCIECTSEPQKWTATSGTSPQPGPLPSHASTPPARSEVEGPRGVLGEGIVEGMRRNTNPAFIAIRQVRDDFKTATETILHEFVNTTALRSLSVQPEVEGLREALVKAEIAMRRVSAFTIGHSWGWAFEDEQAKMEEAIEEYAVAARAASSAAYPPNEEKL